MDPFWIFLIACVIFGNLGGMYAAKQSRIKAVAVAPDKSRICSCEHGYGTHRDGKSCVARIEVTNYEWNGSRSGKKWVRCPCLLFDGIPPIDVLGWYPPEIKP